MAESIPSSGVSSVEGPDQVQDTHCEPCYEVSYKEKPCAGHCQNCDVNLCWECFISHRGHKLFRNHKLVKNSPRPNLQLSLGTWLKKVIHKKVRENMSTVALIIVAIILTSIFIKDHKEELRNLVDVVNEDNKLQDEFVDLMTKTADIVKREDFTKIVKIVMEQINKLIKQLETLKENKENYSLFIATKNAQDQLQSLEDKLDKLDKDNIVKENKKLKFIFKVKRLTHVEDIIVKSSSMMQFQLSNSHVVLNKEILILHYRDRKLLLFDTNKEEIAQLELSGNPMGVTKVSASQIAVIVHNPNTIQFISVSQKVMSKVREFKCDGHCRGIIYNERDKTLIVSFLHPHKVKIIDMAGTEIKCLEHDDKGHALFNTNFVVALSSDMTNIYVTNWRENSVTLMSLDGDVKAVYTDKTNTLNGLEGVYVHKSGLVYVVGGESHTVHELDPDSGEFKVVLEEKDGLKRPLSISYCEMEDKMYIGLFPTNVLKVFQMK